MTLTSLQNIFNKVLAGEEVYILFADRKAYDASRVALLKKWRNLKEMFDQLGADSPYAGKFLQCSFEKDLVRGKFVLADESARKNVPIVDKYKIADL